MADVLVATWLQSARSAYSHTARCAGRMELIATIDNPAVIHRILAHLALPGARDDPEPAAAVSPRETTSPRSPSRSCRDVAGPPALASSAPSHRRAMMFGVSGPPAGAV